MSDEEIFLKNDPTIERIQVKFDKYNDNEFKNKQNNLTQENYDEFNSYSNNNKKNNFQNKNNRNIINNFCNDFDNSFYNNYKQENNNLSQIANSLKSKTEGVGEKYKFENTTNSGDRKKEKSYSSFTENKNLTNETNKLNEVSIYNDNNNLKHENNNQRIKEISVNSSKSLSFSLNINAKPYISSKIINPSKSDSMNLENINLNEKK